jgi:hypothetical protein
VQTLFLITLSCNNPYEDELKFYPAKRLVKLVPTWKVWTVPFSLATTQGIHSDFVRLAEAFRTKSGFFVSFLLVTEMFHFASLPPIQLCIHCMVVRHNSNRVSPFGNLRVIASVCRLLEAYRMLQRPLSAFCAKASAIYS